MQLQQTRHEIPDNSIAFRQFLAENRIEGVPNGSFTSIFQDNINVFTLGVKYGEYKAKFAPSPEAKEVFEGLKKIKEQAEGSNTATPKVLKETLDTILLEAEKLVATLSVKHHQ